LGTKPIKLTFENISINPESFIVGEFIKQEYILNLVNEMNNTLLESGYTATTSKGVFTNINVSKIGESSVINFQSRNGLIIKLKGAEEFITDKFLLGLERYNHWQQEGVVSGIIEVWYSQADNKIYARYIDE